MARSEFSHRSLHGAPRGRRTLLFATLIILAIFAIDFFTGGVVRTIFRNSASRLWVGAASARSSIAGSGFFARNSTLATENETLKHELSEVRERAAAYGTLKSENDSLRAMVHLTQSAPGITAPVVSSYHASPYGTFIVGAGKDDGIAVGDLVLSETGYVVGRVTDVGPKRTLVKNIFLSGSAIDVIIGNAAVTATGEGGGNARVAIPRGIDVQIGDTVTSPVVGARPVGVVGKVEQISASAEQKVYIAQPVNLSLLRFVYIVPAP